MLMLQNRTSPVKFFRKCTSLLFLQILLKLYAKKQRQRKGWSNWTRKRSTFLLCCFFCCHLRSNIFFLKAEAVTSTLLCLLYLRQENNKSFVTPFVCTQKLAVGFKPSTFVKTSYLNTHVCKFEPSQKHESRAQSADSSKVYSKLITFNVCFCLMTVTVDVSEKKTDYDDRVYSQ